jgi:hypothetical protein
MLDLPEVTHFFTTLVNYQTLYLPSQDITADESFPLERYPVFHALLSESRQLWNVTLSSVNPIENVWYFMIYTDCGKAQIGPTSWWIELTRIKRQNALDHAHTPTLDIFIILQSKHISWNER